MYITKCFFPITASLMKRDIFKEGDEYKVFCLNGVTFGVSICEDIWFEEGPVRVLSLAGNADLIININSSPYHAGKWKLRRSMLIERAKNNRVAIAYITIL